MMDDAIPLEDLQYKERIQNFYNIFLCKIELMVECISFLKMLQDSRLK